MNIVCLAWGSLIWRPGILPLDGPWRPDGPKLPIEFARVGDKGELATVLCPGAPLSPVQWAKLNTPELAAARQLLRRREEIPRERVDGVGSVIVGQPPGPLFGSAEILAWATKKQGSDAVIWTSLPPRLAGVEGRVPSRDEAVAYLKQLSGEERRHAEDYVRRVPDEIQTPNRAVLFARLLEPAWRYRRGRILRMGVASHRAADEV